MAAEQVDTIVGVNVELKGSLHNTGPIHVHGKVTGDIVSQSLVVIGETAQISGPITAKQVDVSGQVHGSITAEEHIELQPKSIVKGDLSTNKLTIKPGALFVGQSQMNIPAELGEEKVDKKKPRLEIE
jgi:cytoskeletal protein CcmA (bactofilin family)